uniref:CalV n=1 Tax=uncultured Candidatus Entotheonella sp. TaxID=312019 RepID=A0A068PCC8_9BACT|nr:CalV [uncultured Candidatus Entotheonella sp.]
MQENGEQVVKNGVKIVDELLLPGTSLLLDGKIRPGMAHSAVGLLAGVALGVPGAMLVAANALAQSVTGAGLIANLTNNSPKNPRDVNLAERVAVDVAEGMTYEEIREDILEDIEDLYHEATADKTPHQKDAV